MTTMPNQYYQRFDPAKNYEEHLFIAGRGLQSAELNEMQKGAMYRLRGVADSLFKDGGIVRDAGIVVNETTGVTQCASGAVYIRGAVRGVAPATFTIPVVGTIAVGIRLIETVKTAIDDPTLRDPATGTRNYDERGAERLEVVSQWGWDGDDGDGEFYPVYGVIDGVVTAKEPPPNLDTVTQALARYDRDSAGGSYIVSGMNVSMLADSGGNQVYSIADGRARVYGFPIEFPTSRRVVLAAAPDLLAITNEPHLSTSIGAQRINLDRTPATNITQVAITAEKTVTLTHGVTTGSQDPLPDTSVLSLIEVKQGGTTYTFSTDYLLTAGKVDWTPGGAEPAPGSTYTVKYQYITNVTPTAVDETGFTVTGAVVGTLVLTDYSQKLPRVDRLCLDADGFTVWVTGVASSYAPKMPSVPGDFLPLATVYQTWTSARTIRNDGVRVVPMPILAGFDQKIDYVLQLVAQQRLESSIHTRESGTKKGLFVDPFLDDSQRDAGTPQTAAIVDGELILPITPTIKQMPTDVTAPTTASYVFSEALAQLLKTSSMKINPYLTFGVVPAKVTLEPAVDRWTTVETDWSSGTTRRLVIIGSGDNQQLVSQVQNNVLVGTTVKNAEKLRSIEIKFEVTGFGAGEALTSVTFDGIPVTPVAI